MKLLWCFLLFTASVIVSYGQAIEINGCVFDKEKDEPIPFATVGVQGTAIGTVTGFDGCFRLQVKNVTLDTLVISTLGYDTRKYAVKTLDPKGQTLYISATDLLLEEITIMAGENPALRILDSMLVHKQSHNQKKYDNYGYEQYSKVELDLINIKPKDIEGNILLKKFDFILDNVDSTSEDQSFLPVFLTETFGDFYYSSNPKKKKELIKATKVSGMKNATVTQFLGSMYQDINVYKDYIKIVNKGFVSPVSISGLSHYKYYRIDSGIIEGYKCYKLQFMPKKKHENVFVGDMWVCKGDWAIKQISMEVSGSANVNYVDKVGMFQSFDKVNGKWILAKDKLVIHFLTENEKRPGMIGRKTSSYAEQMINDPRVEAYIDSFKDINQIVIENSDKKVHDWQSYRHDTLSENEQKVYAMIDTLNNVPIFRTYVDVVKTIFSGYYQVGMLSFGPYFNLISTDQIEGWRFAFGARTNENFSKRFRQSFYGAYGLRDQAYKYGLSTNIILNKKRWTMLNYKYTNDLDLVNDDISEVDNDNIVAGLVQKNIEQRLVYIDEHYAEIDREWKRGVWTKMSLERKWQSPYFDFDYQGENGLDSVITTTEAGLMFRFSKGEKFVNTNFRRQSLGGKSPIWYVYLNKGIRGIAGGQFDYLKVKLRVADQLPVYPVGYVRYTLTAGKTFGNVPYLLLEVPKGNFTYYFNPNAFNSMNPYEFATDEYLHFNMTHYLDGAILNKIPLMRKLKWRGLWSTKAIYGRYSAANRDFIVNDNIKILNNSIYAESAIGVENILKLVRVDLVHRWTHLRDTPNYPISKWGIYASIQFKF